jgi:hypothetical protein
MVGLSTTETILLTAGHQLQDATKRKWGIDKLLLYLNLGIIEIVNLKPEAYTTTIDLTLVEGPVQKLPDSFIALVDVTCNLAADGETPGQSITGIEKKNMDHMLPGWMTFPSSATVSYAVTDAREPKKLYVFPPQPAGQANKVRTLMAVAPDPIESGNGTFPLDDSYRPAIIDYIIFRCLAEETTVPNALNKSTMYRNLFLQDLGIKTAAEGKSRVKEA